MTTHTIIRTVRGKARAYLPPFGGTQAISFATAEEAENYIAYATKWLHVKGLSVLVTQS